MSNMAASEPMPGTMLSRIKHTAKTIRINIHVPGCFLNSAKPSAIHSQPRPASTARPVAEKAPAGAGAGTAGG